MKRRTATLALCAVPAHLCGDAQHSPGIIVDLSQTGIAESFDTIRLTDSDLYVSSLSNRLRQRMFMRISRSGVTLQTETISSQGLSGDAAFDESGRAMVTRRLPDGSPQLELYKFGAAPRLYPLPAPPASVIGHDHSLLELAIDGVIRPVPADGSMARRTISTGDETAWAKYFVLVDHQVVALIDKWKPIATFVDLATGEKRQVVWDSSEIRSATTHIEALMSKAPRGVNLARPLLFYDATTDGKGSLYVAVSGVPLYEGTVLLQFDKTGSAKRGIRLAAPTAPRLKSDRNPGGWATQRRFSANASAIASLSDDGVLSIFDLR